MLALLRQCVLQPQDLTGREVARARETIAQLLHSRGQAGSERRVAVEMAGAAQVEACRRGRQAATELLERLRPFAGDGGCTLPRSELLAPVNSGAMPRALPPSFALRALRCLDMPLEQHLVDKTIASAESMATILPCLAARSP